MADQQAPLTWEIAFDMTALGINAVTVNREGLGGNATVVIAFDADVIDTLVRAFTAELAGARKDIAAYKADPAGAAARWAAMREVQP